MHKHLLKKTIEYVNEYSLSIQNLQVILETIEAEKGLAQTDTQRVIDFLATLHAVSISSDLINFRPCTFIFSKSTHHSAIEALALFEMLLPIYHTTIETQTHFSGHQFEPLVYQVVQDTILFEGNSMNPILQTYTDRILQEAKKDVLSDTLSVLFTKFLIQHTDNTPYKNEERKIVDYENLDFILETIPRKGIPENREISKNLQIFYKDTQMHEFHKACPICGIHIPHMLIASHIKPFRDCAHIYEAADHNNGLLLCRNHDYLFDQGYISFQDDGTLILSEELKEENIAPFQLHNLDKKYLTKNRIKFLKYHRNHILKK